ncbi:hypothetical protein C5167_007180 [Papaver somniferum]|uniref:Uncharacterized protein n=1 Tax=Papaver somniferum TaxID=3469 RepID=A0A4Y7JJE9_PAPSO|nr:hypothetical protein C5167_007180 [Papaver somniferum]
MCNPMVDYVQGIKAEIATGGALKKLIDVVSEMDRVILDGRLKLAKAKKEARIEQARMVEALSRLKETEEKRLALNELFGFLLKAKNTQRNLHYFNIRVPIANGTMALRSKAGHHSVARLRGAMEDGKGRPLLSCVAERCKGRWQRQTTTQFCD